MAGPAPENAEHGNLVVLHASTIAAGDRAALIRGASGTGKSDLALRCISKAPTPLLPQQARLVSDDQTIIERSNGQLLASAPEQIAGLLEVRGIGILRVNDAVAPGKTPLALVVDLDEQAEKPERLPDPWPTVAILGVEVPLLRLRFNEVSAPERLLLAISCYSLPATG